MTNNEQMHNEQMHNATLNRWFDCKTPRFDQPFSDYAACMSAYHRYEAACRMARDIGYLRDDARMALQEAIDRMESKL